MSSDDRIDIDAIRERADRGIKYEPDHDLWHIIDDLIDEIGRLREGYEVVEAETFHANPGRILREAERRVLVVDGDDVRMVLSSPEITEEKST